MDATREPKHKQEPPTAIRLSPEAKRVLPELIDLMNQTVPVGFGPITKNALFSVLILQAYKRLKTEQKAGSRE